MYPLITQHIDSMALTNQQLHCFAARLFKAMIVMLILFAGWSGESQAQIKSSMKIKLNVLPSINITRMDGDLQILFAEDITHMNELVSVKNGGEDIVSLDFGFSISAYENITVLLSFTNPELFEKNKQSVYPMRIDCGYLNDGTTYFTRATITNRNSMQFRLRNNNLLKRSMKLSDPLFVAYTFFLVHHQKATIKNKGPLPVSTITLEYM
ncbi:MAG: hypothetical protein NTX44_02045 [Ignavibacteriales bacterium]|nr:hypothetical protein [Ignavibacteriales bacterium]